MATVGIVASPSAGKDVRRLVANAGSVGDVDKIAVIRRAAIGAVEGGADRLLVLDDKRHLIRRALDEAMPGDVEVEVKESYRNMKEVLSLAKAMDMLLDEVPDIHRLRGFDLLMRRFRGVMLADEEQNWDVCSTLTGEHLDDELLVA